MSAVRQQKKAPDKGKAIEEESAKEEQDSDATQMSDLEQEDSDIPLTEDEQ